MTTERVQKLINELEANTVPDTKLINKLKEYLIETDYETKKTLSPALNEHVYSSVVKLSPSPKKDKKIKEIIHNEIEGLILDEWKKQGLLSPKKDKKTLEKTENTTQMEYLDEILEKYHSPVYGFNFISPIVKDCKIQEKRLEANEACNNSAFNDLTGSEGVKQTTDNKESFEEWIRLAEAGFDENNRHFVYAEALFPNEKGVKETTNKPEYSEINLNILDIMDKRFAENKDKYPVGNMKKIIDVKKLENALFRHAKKIKQADKDDTESYIQHLASIACNVSMILDQIDITNFDYMNQDEWK